MFSHPQASSLAKNIQDYVANPNDMDLAIIDYQMNKFRESFSQPHFYMSMDQQTLFSIFLRQLFSQYSKSDQQAVAVFQSILHRFVGALTSEDLIKQLTYISFNETPLTLILKYGNRNILNIFLETLYDNTVGHEIFFSTNCELPLFATLQQKNPAQLQQLIVHLEKVTEDNPKQMEIMRDFLNPHLFALTPLHFIARTGHMGLLELYQSYLNKYYGEEAALSILKNQALTQDLMGNLPYYAFMDSMHPMNHFINELQQNLDIEMQEGSDYESSQESTDPEPTHQAPHEAKEETFFSRTIDKSYPGFGSGHEDGIFFFATKSNKKSQQLPDMKKQIPHTSDDSTWVEKDQKYPVYAMKRP